MPKQIAFLLAAFLIFLAALVITERTFSPTFQQCVGAKEQNKETGVDKEQHSASGPTIYNYVRCTGEFLDASEGTITALATIIIAAFTCTLWIATSNQGQLTREALVADKRAFVFATGFTPYWEKDSSGRYNWRFRPVWRNSGDTPTRRLTQHTACELRNTPLPDDFNFNYPTKNSGVGLLGPRYENMGGIAPPSPSVGITSQDILDVQEGRKFLYLMGWARYFDVFPDTPEHITRFCWIILPSGDPFTFVPNDAEHALIFPYAHFGTGNCADDECDA